MARDFLGEIVSINYSWGELDIFSRDCIDIAPVPVGSILDESTSSFDVDIEADDIDVTDTITVVWEIR